MKFIGVMTGTSLDGLDACLIDCHEAGISRLASCSHEMAPGLRDQFTSLLSAGLPNALEVAAQAGLALSNAVADLVEDLLRQTGLSPDQVTALGVHGQTVRHRPGQGFSLQLLAAPSLAERTGIAVAFDFRSRDIAAGGQGAPLVPPFHAALMCQAVGVDHPPGWTGVLNLGGMANVSLMQLERVAHPTGPEGQSAWQARALSGFDTGPANTLLDGWVQRHLGQPYDTDGAWASEGTPHAELLQACLRDPFFRVTPPKSTGRDHFNLAWLDAQLASTTGQGQAMPSASDVQATLLALTITSIAQALPRDIQSLWICGGGARNKALVAGLADATGVAVTPTDLIGWPTQDIEAAAFGWLAWRLHCQRPGNDPGVTGARGPRLLGCWAPA